MMQFVILLLTWHSYIMMPMITIIIEPMITIIIEHLD